MNVARKIRKVYEYIVGKVRKVAKSFKKNL